MRKKKKDSQPILPADTAEQFEIQNWKGGTRQDFGSFGIIDLKKLTIKQAKRLFSLGFPKIKKK